MFPLTIGSKGQEVKNVQRFINAASQVFRAGVALKVDGSFTKATGDALQLLFRRRTVSEKDYQVVVKWLPAAEKRAAQLKGAKAGIEARLAALMAADERLLKSLIRLYGLVDRLRKRGVDLTPYAKRIRDGLQAARDLNDRQKAIRENKSFRMVLANRYDKAYKEFVEKQRRASTSVSGAGEVAATAALWTLSVVTLGIPALIFMEAADIGPSDAVASVSEYIRRQGEKSRRDFEISEETAAILAKLSPEDQKALKKEVNEQIDDAYSDGRQTGVESASKGWKKWAIGGGVAVGGGFLVRKAMQWWRTL